MSTERTQQIETEAGSWLVRRDSGNWSSRDETDFASWMNQSMAHRVAYWRMEDGWEKALRLKALGAGIHSDEPPPPGHWNLSPYFKRSEKAISHLQRSFRLRIRVLVASLAAVVVLATAGYLWQMAGRFQTAVGDIASVPMSDGSQVTLNTDSVIKLAINDKERGVELKHGEAFFEVARDPSRPFVVSVGNKRVIALGTKFSVRRDLNKAGDIQVIVTEGAVRVESAGSNGTEILTQHPLAAGTVARTAGHKLIMEHKQPREVEDTLSWRNGTLIFRDISLADAAAEFNRYNRRKIVIEDATAAGLRIAGSFRTTAIESFVDIIERGYPVHSELQNDKIVVAADRKP